MYVSFLAYSSGMDLEAWYQQNEARRESAEFEFGDSWSDKDDTFYELTWVEATGELYLMAEPESELYEDAFGDFYVGEGNVDDLTVVVIARLGSLEAVETALAGWEEAMSQENSLAWLYARFGDRS
jgi:hypothetical protein